MIEMVTESVPVKPDESVATAVRATVSIVDAATGLMPMINCDLRVVFPRLVDGEGTIADQYRNEYPAVWPSGDDNVIAGVYSFRGGQSLEQVCASLSTETPEGKIVDIDVDEDGKGKKAKIVVEVV